MRNRGLVGPGRFPPAQVAEIKALACELPAESGRPLSRWSSAEIAKERGIVCEISGTTVWRYVAEDAIRPWAWRSWIFPRDPRFAEKAGRVLDLYERRWEGKLLHLATTSSPPTRRASCRRCWAATTRSRPAPADRDCTSSSTSGWAHSPTRAATSTTSSSDSTNAINSLAPRERISVSDH
jgi:hypothetical protein